LNSSGHMNWKPGIKGSIAVNNLDLTPKEGGKRKKQAITFYYVSSREKGKKLVTSMACRTQSQHKLATGEGRRGGGKKKKKRKVQKTHL